MKSKLLHRGCVYLLTIFLLIGIFPVVASAHPFTDVGENKAVEFCLSKGYIIGTADDKFTPNGTLDRAQIATILARMAGNSTSTIGIPFTDVPLSSWYYGGVVWGYQTGLIMGMNNTTFAPYNTITRAQMVSLLYRYRTNILSADVSTQQSWEDFRNGYLDSYVVENSASYAQAPFIWAVEKGLISTPGGMLLPGGHLTRLETAEIIYKFSHLPQYSEPVLTKADISFHTSITGGKIIVSCEGEDDQTITAHRNYHGASNAPAVVSVPVGKDITLTFIPNNEYKFAYLKDAGARVPDRTITKNDNGYAQYIIPSISSHMKFDAHFAIQETLAFANAEQNFVTKDDLNPRYVDLQILQTAFKGSSPKDIKDLHDSLNEDWEKFGFAGNCFGMLAAVALMNNDGGTVSPTALLQSFSDDYKYSLPYEVNLEDQTDMDGYGYIFGIKDMPDQMRLKELIECLQVLQHGNALRAEEHGYFMTAVESHYLSPQELSTKKSENAAKLEKLAAQARVASAKSPYIYDISYWADLEGKHQHDSGHSVLFRSFEAGGNQDYIYVYDPNYPNDKDCKIVLYKENGNYIGWAYSNYSRSDKTLVTCHQNNAQLASLSFATLQTIWQNRSDRDYYISVELSSLPANRGVTVANPAGGKVVFVDGSIVEVTMDNVTMRPITGLASKPIAPIVSYPPGEEYTFQATDGKNLKFYAYSGRVSVGIEGLPHTIARISLDQNNPAKTYAILEGEVGDQIARLELYGGAKDDAWSVHVSGTMCDSTAKLQRVSGGYELSGFGSFTVNLESSVGVRYKKTITNHSGDTIRIDANDCTFSGGGLAPALSCPKNLKYEGTSVSWDAVPYATGYEIELYRVEKLGQYEAVKPEVYINTYQVTGTSYTLPHTYEDHYIIAIRALDSTNSYEPSAFLYTKEAPVIKLDPPKLISFVNSQASWEPVDNAIGYAPVLYLDTGDSYLRKTKDGVWNNDAHTDFTFRLMGYDYDLHYYIGLTANANGHIYTSSDMVYYKMQWQTPAPENLMWAKGVISWDASKWANGYEVQIFAEDGTPVGDPIKTNQTYLNVSNKLEIGETYTYQVFSLGDNDWYVDGKIGTSGKYTHSENTPMNQGGPVSQENNQIKDDPSVEHKCRAFADIASHWGYSDICYCVERDIMNGVSTTQFQPNASLTRAMLVTVLYRMDGSTATGTSGFSDVPAGTWYTHAVAWAESNQIVNGISATVFAPNEPITREQLAAIMMRYTSVTQQTLPEPSGKNASAFSDYGQTADYAKAAMDWAVKAGLISGNSNNQLAPQGQATRAEVAAILHRYMENLTD